MRHLGTLLLEMHSSAWVGQFKVQIFVNETSRMGEVVLEIVRVHVVIVDKHSAILTLGFEVESNIVPVGWPHLVVWVLRVPEVLGQRQRQCTRLKQGHLTLEVLVFTCVVLYKKF